MNKQDTASISLSQINVYPVKSISGISLSSAWVEKQGLSFDRRFIVSDYQGKMITSRTHPQLLQVKAALTATGMKLSAPEMPALTLDYAAFTQLNVDVTVWSDSFTALSTSDEANIWFSQLIGQEVQLLYTGEQSQRFREKLKQNVSFADGYPMLLISEAALEELNRRSPVQHTMAQFRPNLVVANTTPFAEDSWKRIRIGEVEFEVKKPCSRCILTTIDPLTSMQNPQKEPLNTLSQFRSDGEEIYFGQNLVALNEGVIREGDTVEILETQQPARYPEREALIEAESKPSESTPSTSVTITINGASFIGNTHEPLLLQAERENIALPHRCRVGLCGQCKVTLDSGNVDQPEKPALSDEDRNNNKILTCCCVPKGDLAFSV